MKIAIYVLVFIFVLSLFVPYPIKVTEPVAIKIVDQAGHPIVGIPVTQSWVYFQLTNNEEREVKISNGSGKIFFSARSMLTCLGWRLLKGIQGKVDFHHSHLVVMRFLSVEQRFQLLEFFVDNPPLVASRESELVIVAGPPLVDDSSPFGK